jgi:hypothetical protein
MPFKGPDYTKEQAKLVEKIKKLTEEINKLDKAGSADDAIQLNIIKEKEKKLKDLQKTLKENNKIITDTLEDFEDMDDTMVSFANTMKKNNNLVQIQADNFTKVKLVATSIGDELKKGGTTNEKTQKQVMAVSNQYKAMHISIAQINKDFAMGKVSNEQRVELIEKQAEAFNEVVSVVDMAKVSSADLKKELEEMTHESHSFAKGMQNATIQAETAEKIVEGFEGAIPGLNEINKLIKTNKADTVAWKLAVFALGAALGKAAMDYFGAPIKAAMEAHREYEQNEIDTVRDVAKLRKEAEFIPQKIAQEKLEAEVKGNAAIAKAKHESEFASQRAAVSFSDTMAKGAAQFQAAAKTGLFGKNIGSIGYGAGQMSIAGIGADKVAAAMEAASSATGKMPTAKMGADMAIMAERTGTSADDIANINESFQRLDGVSAGVAMNLQEGMRNMADQAGIGLGKLMKEVAQASKEALGYQIKSGPALAKQVAYAQSLGVNFMDIAKAGKNMVLNYKDSIKSEMQLSSMLGEQVDLSEARAAFAAGDTDKGLAAIKSQGLDPADMDMFQQQALQDALGGLDLNSISKVAQNTGKGASLNAADAKKGNQQFLGAKQGAAASLNAQEASISAKTAELSAELEKEIEQSYLDSDGHKKQLEGEAEAAIAARELAGQMNAAWVQTDAFKKAIADTAKLNFKEKILDGLLSGIAAAFGGLALSKIMGGGGGGGLMGMITGGGAKAAAGGATSAVGAAVGGVETAAGGVASAGGGIGGSLTIIATGLASFANPATLIGLAAITAALLLLEPVIKDLVPVMVEMARVIGEVLVKALEMAGPIITAILEGIGKVIESIGKAISMVITSVADSLVKIGGIDGANLLVVAAALIPLAAGLVALGAGELINGITSFIGSLFGGGGPTIWEKLMQLGESGPGLMQAATAVSVLAPAFAMLSQVDDGKNLGALMDNLKSALDKLDDKTRAAMKDLAGAMHDFGYGAFALGVVRSNPNLEILAGQLKLLLADDVTSAIKKGAPVIDLLQKTLTSFNTSTTGLAMSLAAANPQLMMLLNTMTTFSQISTGIDTTTMALTNMALALREVAKINTTNLTKVPWKDMAGFSAAKGNFVLAQSANNNFNIQQESAKNIEKLAKDSNANLQVSKNLQALMAVLADNGNAAFQLNIDGRAVTNMIQKRAEDRKGQKKE